MLDLKGREEGRVEFNTPAFFICVTNVRKCNLAALHDHRLLRLTNENIIRKRVATAKMTVPNRSVFTKASFMMSLRFRFVL